MKPIRLLLVDDKPSVRRGLRMRLQLEKDLVVVGEAADGSEAIERALALTPDVVLMDAEMPRMGGIEATRELTRSGCACAVVMLTLYDTADLRQAALAAGAKGFVAKQQVCDELIEVVRTAIASPNGWQEADDRAKSNIGTHSSTEPG